MIFFIFSNGYATADIENPNSPELNIELQNETIPHTIVTEVTKPLFVNSEFNLESDDSFQRYLSNSHPFDNLNYVPADLAPINSNFTANNARNFQLRKTAGDSFADMAWHFRDYFK